MTERDTYWAVRSAQSDGMSLSEYLKMVKQYWVDAREETLARERELATSCDVNVH